MEYMEMDQKLITACSILFGPQAGSNEQELLRRLSAPELKRAFRKIALKTHPDRAPGCGAPAGSADSSRFVEALRAYELLFPFLQDQTSESSNPGRSLSDDDRNERHSREATFHRSGNRDAEKGNGKELYYRGPLPKRPLRFAEFLYYSGLISWQSMVRAIVRQRLGRPKFGQIARELGYFAWDDLIRLLQLKQQQEQTGQAASRLNLLSTGQVKAVLRRQWVLEKPIGSYIVEMNKITREDVGKQLFRFFCHNKRYRG